jgi:hypothetical protein
MRAAVASSISPLNALRKRESLVWRRDEVDWYVELEWASAIPDATRADRGSIIGVQ